MASNVITCWELNRWDGGDRTNHYAFFSNEEAAKELKGRGDYIQIREFVIHDTKQDCLDFKNGETKKRALEKLKSFLSDDEIVSLGLKL